MTRRTVALTGIPGVGKSTLLTELSTQLSFISLNAGALIRKGRKRALDKPVSPDRLHYDALDEAQNQLIQAFEAITTEEMPLVVLDSHSVVERVHDHILIDAAVFGAIGINAMIFLRDDPIAISGRRAQDARRHRPKKGAAALDQLQKAAYAQATNISRTLQIQLYDVTPQDVEVVSEILRRTRDGLLD